MCGVSESDESEEADSSRSFLLSRIPLLIGGAAALVLGLCTGLVRMGVSAPFDALAEFHGPLLICGFFGTLTSLERAAAANRPFAYLAPSLCVSGTALIFAGVPMAGAALYALAAALVCVPALGRAARERKLFAVTLAGPSSAWLVGNLVWLSGAPVPDAGGFWLMFLVLVIGGERLEFGRPRPRTALFPALFWTSLALLAAGSWMTVSDALGGALFGAGLFLSALWIGWHDLRLCLSRRSGKGRFMAVNLMAGCVWLGIGGLVQMVGAAGTNAFAYDMTIHAVVIGFALSMVFAHALLVFPAIVRAELVFSFALYVPVALLQAAIALRLIGGLMQWMEARMLSGTMTVLALVLFATIVAAASLRARYIAAVRQPVRA